MKSMKVQNAIWQDGKKEVGLGDFLKYVLNITNVQHHPRGLEAGRKYKEFIDAFDTNDDFVIIKKDSFFFGKKFIEDNIPAIWTADKNIELLLEALKDAEEYKEEKKE